MSATAVSKEQKKAADARDTGHSRRHVQPHGPWPFVTNYSIGSGHRRVVWGARQLRKGLRRQIAGRLAAGPVPAWRSRRYNRLIAQHFATGAALFILGAVLSLLPPAHLPIPKGWINIIFFLGSVPFTTGAYLQLFQAANPPPADPAAAPASPASIALFGWLPRSAGWVSSAAQFLGTIDFNFNTWDAIGDPGTWYMQDIDVWAPGMIGSILFLFSGYLAFVETAGRYWAWRPRDLDWQIVTANLLGCIFFVTASLFAFVPKGPEMPWVPVVANIHLALGGLSFLVGSLLLIRESAGAAAGSEAAA